MFLDLMEDVIKEVNVTALRPRIEHAQILAPTDLARFGTLGGMYGFMILVVDCCCSCSLQSSQVSNLVTCKNLHYAMISVLTSRVSQNR